MNWEAISAIGEIIGAIAVIISLVYLALQVRSGTRALKTENRDSSFQSLMEFNYSLVGDPDLAYIFQAGCHDFQGVEERERARLVHLLYSFFKMFEKMYLHYLEESVDKTVWIHNRSILFAYSTQPGAQHYLSHRRQIFDPRFLEVLESASSIETPGGHIVSNLDLDN
jgi:hypothetical protein